MKKESMVLGILTLSAFVLSGCLVTTKTYPLTKDRVDQSLSSGNRGYLKGQAPAEADNKPRKTTRVTRVVEVEFGDQAAKQQPVQRQSAEPEYSQSQEQESQTYQEEPLEEVPAVSASFENYKVQKNDTLQKISRKFYGTTRKWTKIYEANRDVLKAPNKIYPGQTIKIPVENTQLKETGENLK
ncbi:MAG: LysM peptidoglycan-binding domain-containing protein [Candidatus Omnitrophota bacterium]